MNPTTPQDKATASPWFKNGNAISADTKDGIDHICSKWIGNVQRKETFEAENWEANAALIVRAVNQFDALCAVAEAGNDLAEHLQLYFDARSKCDEVAAAWKLEQVAKSLRIYQSQKVGSPIQHGKQSSNFGLAAVRKGAGQ